MANAIGMVELTSIARGIETSDFMVKAAQVELIRSSTVCPGKYIIIIAGDTATSRPPWPRHPPGGESVVNTLLLPNAHPQLIPAISMTTQPPAGARWGVLEFYSIASAITGRRCGRQGSQRDPDRGAHWIRHRRQGLSP